MPAQRQAGGRCAARAWIAEHEHWPYLAFDLDYALGARVVAGRWAIALSAENVSTIEYTGHAQSDGSSADANAASPGQWEVPRSTSTRGSAADAVTVGSR